MHLAHSGNTARGANQPRAQWLLFSPQYPLRKRKDYAYPYCRRNGQRGTTCCRAGTSAGPQGQRVEPQPDTLADRFDGIDADNPQKNDGVFDVENMPERQEPDEVINDLIQFKHR